ncbi:MAG TPA: NAD-dependent epimerase/dehydratase family protein [Saprospiraceae bacterium]|nr:NAD-dependent epimerase/dehydratase family protein [Saprospiraceae bacterium]
MIREHTIAISCIGSGVGQSVINSLRLTSLPIRTVGLGTNPFAYGAYDCDVYDYTPTIYSEGYVDKLIGKCKEHSVDLIVPGLDDEALIFAQNEEEFKKADIKTICSDEKLISLCRDKKRMCQELNKVVDVFVKSYDKDKLDEQIQSGKVKFPLIAKPRGGFASRGVEIILSRDDLNKIDDNHIIQELAIPAENDPNRESYLKQVKKIINPQVSEISIQLVYDPEQRLMGKMASFNKLRNGVPVEILPYENKSIWEAIDALTPELLRLGLCGPINIQGRLTDSGLKLFEMNPRFTGISGLRALMGFNEVEACVKEWLNIEAGKNKLCFNYSRFGMRQTADKSLPIVRNKKVSALSKKLNQFTRSKTKKVLITGATGYLGQNLINSLSGDSEFEIWAFGRDKSRSKKILTDKPERIYDLNDLENGNIHFGNLDVLLHMGFARPHKNNDEIARSLKFTHEIFIRAARHQVPAIINISSQSVYGLENEPLWTEEIPVYPSSPYAQAKYASELILASLHEMNEQLFHTSIRLGSLAGGAPGLIENDFLSKMTKQALDGEDLTVVGGDQQMERLDIRDAVSGITRLLKTDPKEFHSVYNFGAGVTYSLLDIANKIKTSVTEKTGNSNMKINIRKTDAKPMKFGMDSTKLLRDLDWNPQHSLKDTIESLIKYF